MGVANKPTHYILSNQATLELKFWTKNTPLTLTRISVLIESIMANPHTGLGKPKPLRYSLEGYWFRRIDSEHRIVYRIKGEVLEIIALRGHYEKT